jgi:hypothetical protein
MSKHPIAKPVLGLVGAVLLALDATANYTAIADSGLGGLLGLPEGVEENP